ncbi:MAG: hypothetical protein HN348_22235 [Proteobacteria bacterium]|jgi:hypothetical protein|nr:hypothetical protein [Pseudomonadota bacterium]
MRWLCHLGLALLLFFAPPAIAQPTWGEAPAETLLAHEPRSPPSHFETVKSPFLRVHGAPRDDATLLALAQHGSASMVRLANELRVPIGRTVDVYLAESDEQFARMQPGKAPMWADGTAYAALGAVYLRTPRIRGGQPTPLEVVLDHELIHILLGRAFLPQRVPSWLQEGFAQVYSGEFSPETTRRLAEGMLGGGLIRLDALTRGFPDNPLRARMAYAQSADLISWMRAEHGEEAMQELVEEMARGVEVRVAIRRATGTGLDELDEEWRARLTKGVPLSLWALFDENVLFGLCGLALIVGGLMRRRQFRRRLVEMEEEEQLLDSLVSGVMGGRNGGSEER